MGTVGGGSETGLLAQVVWAESYGGAGGHQDSQWLDEKASIAMTVMNREALLNGKIVVLDADGHIIPATQIVNGSMGADIKGVIGASGAFSVITGGPTAPRLTSGFQTTLEVLLDEDISNGHQVGIQDPSNGSWYTVSEQCYNIIESYVRANLAIQKTLTDPFAANGGLTLGLNRGNVAPGLDKFGKADANSPTNFYGISSNWYVIRHRFHDHPEEGERSK
jgi:hypothetical protein